VKFFHQPHVYSVTALPSKTNTTANIGVKCLHFSRNVMLSVGEYLVWGRQRWYSSILELTAHTAAISYSCLTSEQYVVITDGHCSRMDCLKKEHTIFTETYIWPPDSSNINPVDYAIWGALQQRVYRQR